MPSVNPLEKKADLKLSSKLPREQKVAVVFLAILGIAAIVLWVFQAGAQLSRPMGGGKIPKVVETEAGQETDSKDSDKDGLTDYEETNVYNTSPYLEDSDSDGISDFQEIKQGTNPNCPEGENCGATTAETNNNQIINNLNNEITISSEQTVSDQYLSGEVTPALLRQVLLQSGYDQATLDKLSDEDLMKSYQEAVRSQNETVTQD